MRAYRIAYDGRPYYGFQRQPSVPTVEGALLDGLAELEITDRGETPPGYAAAGRTDRGVSALAQTVAFEAPDWATPRVLNGELPDPVCAWASADAADGFHATRDAAWREYRYLLYAPNLPDGRVRAALDRLTGTHDFHNLTAVTDPAVDTTRTVLAATATRDGEFLGIRVRADGFLREMVRRVVTLVCSVAADPVGPDHVPTTGTASVERALSTERLDGPAGIGPAPAAPLALTGVGYPDLAFAADERAVERRRSAFERRRVEAATLARVARVIRDGRS
jgi:tRNA pseudouridine38-40 synthase